MSLSTGRDQFLRARRDLYRGSVSYHGEHALLDACKAKSGIEVNVPDVKSKGFTAQTSTAAAVVGGPCRLYGVRATSGTTTDPAASAASNDVIVKLLDGSTAIASIKLTKNKDAEGYFYAGTDGVGIPISTSLSVQAVAASDGSSNPSAADRPSIEVLFGV